MNKSCLCLVFVNSAFSFFHINIPSYLHCAALLEAVVVGMVPGWIPEHFERKPESVLVRPQS